MEKAPHFNKKKCFFAFILPAFLIALYYLLRGSRDFMNFWVFKIAGPFEQLLGKVCSVVPFSVLEITALILIAFTLYIMTRGFVFLFKKKKEEAKRCFILVLSFWLWAAALFYYLWNTVYYADSFRERAGMEVRPYSVEELYKVTDHFALMASRYADKVKRNEYGMWDESLDEIISHGPRNYEGIAEEFPCLDIKSQRVKPFILSEIHSITGFTGMYTPYTGEANINKNAPGFLIPSTICHEMTHQRMVSSEAECNFAGITACILSGDPAYIYSGYMSGLIHLCNALYPVSPELWFKVANERFTREMIIDWEYNNAYWDTYSSPVEEIADKTYDTFLKSNGETLGNKSYGACVDLLISYFLPKI